MNALKQSLEKFAEFVGKGALKSHSESEVRLAEGWFIEGYAFGFEAAQMPPPPMQCNTDAEKIAYAFGWFKALELNPARKHWIGFTPEEKLASSWTEGTWADGVAWAEAKLKEKNT